jgi:hypothetical protein
MEIVIKSEKKVTKIIIAEKDIPRLINVVYWFLKENSIPSKVEIIEDVK